MFQRTSAACQSVRAGISFSKLPRGNLGLSTARDKTAGGAPIQARSRIASYQISLGGNLSTVSTRKRSEVFEKSAVFLSISFSRLASLLKACRAARDGQYPNAQTICETDERSALGGLRAPLACFSVFISEWSCLSRFVHSRGGVGFLSVTCLRHRLRVEKRRGRDVFE